MPCAVCPCAAHQGRPLASSSSAEPFKEACSETFAGTSGSSSADSSHLVVINRLVVVNRLVVINR